MHRPHGPRPAPHSARSQWVLLLCVAVWLALVPLRGWAQVSMPLAAAAQAAAEANAMPMPCHGSASTDGGADGDTAAPEAHTPCSDCALCHAVAAPAPTGLAPLLRPTAPGWQAHPSAAAPAQPQEAPFKPPRA